ncbi:restriction endonuclease [Litchfieldella xinjiangensis]|uniref:restriction endonuclease n=1 Tax=Litchfieldella xinjiangensis TaxID=1166948 RepID=UPI0005BC5B66|nr:restriction endonuclease [Halomonas xinjiangensis]
MGKQAFAFARVPDEISGRIYEEIALGRSRFGTWDQEVSLRERYHGKNGFLLKIEEGDWIVHINLPSYGKCVAVQAIGEYHYDEGIPFRGGRDYNNYIPVNPETMMQFSRNDPNVLPSVNLKPYRRGQPIHNVKDLLSSLENVKQSRYDKLSHTQRCIVHLQDKVNQTVLPQLTEVIHSLFKGKDFERFLHEVFLRMPNTVSVKNGFGWGTDHGADLIVTFKTPLLGDNLTTTLVVQAKSFSGEHWDTKGVAQLEIAIENYQADGGLLVTTGIATEALEDCLVETSDRIGKTIKMIAGAEVARMALQHAPDLLLGKQGL